MVCFHKWSKERGYHQAASNIIEYEQHCLKCGKVKRRYELTKTRV